MRLLSQTQKVLTRPLWEEIFLEDGPDFLDYYYREKTKDNEILVNEADGQIVSMLHMNPCRIYLNGVAYTCPFLVAVATKKEYRGRGYMGELLRRSLTRASEQSAPFVFLVPAAEAIYAPYGFRYVGREYLWDSLPAATADLAERPAEKEDYAELASFLNMRLTEHCGAYVMRSPAYLERLQKERRTDGGDLMVFRDERDNLVGCYQYWQVENEPEIKECVMLAGYGADPVEGDPSVMARICSLHTFVRVLTATEPVSIPLEIDDPIIPENNGRFRMKSSPVRAIITRTETEQEKQEPAVRLTIADLAVWGFGWESPEKLIREGKISGEREQLDKFLKIRPVSNIYINEAV